ncbi:uncharacterized protein FIBRA_04466 [Fibroporia radiculosa]|uniref:Hypercellular protein HypA n=1 Tax=Fibroporia radiculosa TaxID=599839 RepID=J4IA65_9APHY|nr:uncharacterized protein FIBRA_04466 [Fibroporia radiculosa]CCM02371.1 predicted protein [Fibroporia radiculosa]
MDSLAFGSLAHIHILIVPIGNIHRATYEKWASEVRGFETIPLEDIPIDSRDDRARFMPTPLAKGHLHLNYLSHPSSLSHNALSLFRPSEFPLGVIGIASCSQSDSISSILTAFGTAMSGLPLQGSAIPATRNCFVFEDSDVGLDVGDRFPGLVIIPGMMGNKRVHIGTLIAGLCSQILGQFAAVMQSLETPLGNEYLNASLFPNLPPSSEFPKPLDSSGGFRDPAPLPARNSQPDLSNGSSRSKTPLGAKRVSSGPGLAPIRHASLPPTPATTKKRPSAIGAASSHGRLFKVLGDLFLLAGRHADSSVWYTEAIALFKNSQDAVWHASALEGLATIPIVEAWSSSNSMLSSDNEKEPWQDIMDKLNYAQGLYHKTAPPSDAEGSHVHQTYLYAQCVLRQASLLFAVWTCKGWGSNTFANMLHPGPNPFLSGVPSTHPVAGTKGETNAASTLPPKATYAHMERLTTITGISRAQIAGVLAQVHGPWLLHLGPRERITILQATAGMYGALGYLRKEAYILRETLGSIMDLIVCGRQEQIGIRDSGSSSMNRGLAQPGASTSQGTVGIRENQRTEGNDSLLRIVKHICRVHGVDLETVRLVDVSAVSQATSRQDRDMTDDVSNADDDDLSELPQEPFGWPELQIGIVREAIAVAEALPDYPSVAQFSLSSLKMLHPVMSQSDQFHFYHTATRALATAIRRGDRRTVEYWAGRPVISVEVLSLPLIRLPLEKPLSLITTKPNNPSINPIFSGSRDPFLYNPRKLMSGQTQSILVQNERFEVSVTLRNPFIFDLQLESIALSTSGVRIESEGMPVIIPSNSYHPVTISGRALEAGTLVIRGCTVQAPGGVPREYTLPLSSEEDDQRLQRRTTALFEAGRSKRSGLDSRPWKRVDKQAKRQSARTTTIRYLECNVVPEQPLLRIKRTSLTHGAVMLYDGETSTIRLTFENVSLLPINFLRLTFDDSTIAPAQQLLTEGELSIFDTYETEYDLISRPVFFWDSSQGTHQVDPGEKTTVTVKCFGKVGCTSGAVHVSYAYIDRHEVPDKSLDIFHSRQLSYPVVVTVYHMLACHAMDILSFSAITNYASSMLTADDPVALEREWGQKGVWNVDDAADWCLFTVDVRNTYGLPFEVTFERSQPDLASTTRLVPPGSTSRLILPIKKILLSEEHVSRPIPTLSDRQFVVAKSALTSAEEKAQRELFWYREELFKVITGRWKESGGTRTGTLSLRQQRMTLPMLETLRTETVRVQMSLFYRDEDGVSKDVAVDPTRSKYFASPNEFMYLRIKVVNMSPLELVLTLNLTLDPAQHVIHQGTLVDIPVGRLAQAESRETEIPIIFVSAGQFNFTSDVYAITDPIQSGKVGRGQLRTAVKVQDFQP